MLAGANILYGAGMLELGQTFSLEQLVIDDEITGLCRRAVKGIFVNEETVATDLIKEVGIAGDFLTKRHTMQKMRDEQSFPYILSRDMRGIWEKKGSMDLAEAAHKKVVEILKTHQVAPIDRDILADVKAIVSEADKNMRT
jgi:trimethylamine--corrinoid protein Co-methyltransferase